MADAIATRSSRGNPTISLPIAEEAYRQTVHGPVEFRRTIDDCFRQKCPSCSLRTADPTEVPGDNSSACDQAGCPRSRVLPVSNGISSSPGDPRRANSSARRLRMSSRLTRPIGLRRRLQRGGAEAAGLRKSPRPFVGGKIGLKSRIEGQS